jgi:hypothetical protein
MSREPEWASWSDEKLLDVRMSELGVGIPGTRLEERVRTLHRELEARDLRFRPHVWLSDEWFTPDGVPGIAIPFYLAHPRLARLERTQMMEVEGGTPEWCLRILRHEAGHAIENAFRLRQRPRREALFGKTSVPYPEHYVPHPYSRKYVVHLDPWYAQAHPDEDFAETFAVWLDPQSSWRKRYARWPAIAKLRFVDRTMAELRGQKPLVSNKRSVEPLSSLRKTLRTHYQQRRSHYDVEHPTVHDSGLRRLFRADPRNTRLPRADAVIRESRDEARRVVARWTGTYQYVVDRVIDDMLIRARQLGLRAAVVDAQLRLDFTALLTVETMKLMHSGRHRVAL